MNEDRGFTLELLDAGHLAVFCSTEENLELGEIKIKPMICTKITFPARFGPRNGCNRGHLE